MVLYFIWSYCTVSHCYVPLLQRAGELPRSASSHFDIDIAHYFTTSFFLPSPLCQDMKDCSCAGHWTDTAGLLWLISAMCQMLPDSRCLSEDLLNFLSGHSLLRYLGKPSIKKKRNFVNKIHKKLIVMQIKLLKKKNRFYEFRQTRPPRL